MPEKQKFSLSDLTPEEITSFKNDFDAFLLSKSIYFATTVQKDSAEITDPQGKKKVVYFDIPVTVVKKTTPIQAGAVASTDKEINPNA